MTAVKDDFICKLPTLLRLLADPTTPHTAKEIWCRIRSFDLDACVPLLMSELESGVADVKLLVLNIICEEAEQMGCESVEGFIPIVISLLSNEDRLVRGAAIHTVENICILDADLIKALRRIIAFDEPILANQALIKLLLLDLPNSTIREIAPHFRDRLA